MEAKKNADYELHSKSPLFFTIGLVVALLSVTLAFEWRSQYDPFDLSAPQDKWEETYVVPNTAFPAPKPPTPKAVAVKKISNQPPVIVEGDVIKEILVEFTDENDVIPFDDYDMEDLPPQPVEEVHDIVESMPSFPGGISEFYAYVSENLEYPREAKRMAIDGRVFVQFIIDTDGSLIEVKAIKGIGAGCDDEAVRVIENSPKWNPGKQRGRTVKVRMVLPIQFRLN